MKDPLEYTEDELRLMSKEDLKILESSALMLQNRFNISQLVSKTLMNGLYGATANEWFALFNADYASAITGNGRYFIKKLANNIEENLQRMFNIDKPYIVGGDTDSVYFHIEPFVNMYREKNPNLTLNEYVDWVDSFEKKVIQPIVQKTIDDLVYELNAYNKDMIGVEREIISDSAIFCAKKKYFARVLDKEGTRYPEDKPYIKVTGLELIKSSTPTWSQRYLEEAIPHILDKDENDLRDWLNEIKQRFIEADLNDIAAGGGVSRIDYDLAGGSVPIGSRAAIRHNMYVQKYNLTEKYEFIKGGDKCKRLFLIEPNVFESNIIAYTNDNFAEEILKHNCVDYDTQFEKYFLSPLELMVNALNYDLKKETQSLDDW